MMIPWFVWLALLSVPAVAWSQTECEIALPSAGQLGAFDPSLDREQGSRRVWMSFSGVTGMPVSGVPIVAVSTRLAASDDRGETWSELGLVVNAASPEPNPPAEFAGLPSLWQHEVSRLVHDPSAPESERWKLIWHRYLQVDDGVAGTDDRRFNYGWIGMRAAASPEGLVSAAERKLFSAAGYHALPGTEAYNDATLGPPEVRLHELDASLSDCVVFSEPGATATADGLYVSLLCGTADPGARRIVLFKWSHPSGPWQYLGVALAASDAQALDAAFTSFSASDLFRRGRATFLIATPTAAPLDAYSGCVVFRFKDLDRALLRDADENGRKDVMLALTGTPGSFNGACGYATASRRSGVVYSQLFSTPPFFRIFKSGLRPRSTERSVVFVGPDCP